MRSTTKRRLAIGVLAMATGLAVTARLGLAKGPPDEIVIFSRQLSRPIDITDRGTLRLFSPWIGEFIDWSHGPIATPPACGDPYDVRFYQRWEGRRSTLDRGALKFVFGLTYCRLPGKGGIVKLPGPGDRFYDDNTGTIMRPGQDGHWFRASAQWDSVVLRERLRR